MRPCDPGAPPCRCGCLAETHAHYRPGSDCGRCGNQVCEVYRPHDAPPWRDPPPSPMDGVFAEEGWLAYNSPRADIRPT